MQLIYREAGRGWRILDSRLMPLPLVRCEHHESVTSLGASIRDLKIQIPAITTVNRSLPTASEAKVSARRENG